MAVPAAATDRFWLGSFFLDIIFKMVKARIGGGFGANGQSFKQSAELDILAEAVNQSIGKHLFLIF